MIEEIDGVSLLLYWFGTAVGSIMFLVGLLTQNGTIVIAGTQLFGLSIVARELNDIKLRK